MPENKPSSMTVERARALNDIGFEWQLQAHSVPVEWQIHCEEIKTFKSRTGHCRVPQYFIKNKALGHGVATQRKQYKIMSKNKPSRIIVEREQALKDIRLEWKLQAHSVPVE